MIGPVGRADKNKTHVFYCFVGVRIHHLFYAESEASFQDSFSEAGRHGRKRKAGALVSKELKPDLANK